MKKYFIIFSILLILVTVGPSFNARKLWGIEKDIADGNYAKVQERLDNPAYPLSYYLNRTNPPLTMLAAENGRLEILKLLVDRGFNPLQKGLLYCGKDRNDNSFYGTPLCAAAAEGHMDVVRYLIEVSGAKVDGKEILKDGTERGWTALMWAAAKNRFEVVKFLLKAGANVNLQDSSGNTALNIASRLEGDSAMAGFLIQHGASPLIASQDKLLPIHQAARRGNAELCGVLLKAAPDSVNARTDFNETPLMFAAKSGNPDSCSLILKAGAEIESKDNNGSTSFLAAAVNGKLDVMKLLEKEGADKKAKDDYGRTALHLAARRGHATICEWLCPDKDALEAKDHLGQIALHEAALSGDIDTLHFLLIAGSPVNALTIQKMTPLFYSVSGGSVKCTDLLIKKDKASINSQDWYGWTPLFMAVLRNKADIVQSLLKAGAAPDIKTDNGRTPLHLAASANSTKIVGLLLDAGADVNALDSKGRTPLDLAMNAANFQTGSSCIEKLKEAGGTSLNPGKKALFKKLLKALMDKDLAALGSALDTGADPNYHPEMSPPALFIVTAMMSSSFLNEMSENKGEADSPLDIIFAKKLIKAGADPDQEFIDGVTPLHAACLSGNYELAKLFIDAGANVNSINDEGISPLMMAAASGNIKLIKLLLSEGATVDNSSEAGKQLLVGAVLGSKPEECFNILKEAGANPGVAGIGDFNLLQLAAFSRKIESVKFLLKVLPPSANDKVVPSPLDIAEMSHFQEIVTFLKKSGRFKDHKEFHDMLKAIRSNNPDALRAAIREGADPNVQILPNASALSYACSGNKWDAVSALLSEKADPNAVLSGKPPILNSCIRNGAPRKIISLFCSSGANVNSADNTGTTPLMLAIKLDRRDIVEILLASGASMNSRDKEGFTPLHYACNSDSSIPDNDMIKYLISKGASAEAKDKKGRTPLFLVCSGNKNYDLLKILLDAGSPVDSVDNQGDTALHVAAVHSWAEGTVTLLKSGASDSIKNNKGMTPLEAALEAGARNTADRLRLFDMNMLFPSGKKQH